MLLLLIIRRLSQVFDESFNAGLIIEFMVSESNTNRRHLRISNTHDQIHYNNNTSKPGVHIQEYPIQIHSISDEGQIHLYLKVFKYFLSICI